MCALLLLLPGPEVMIVKRQTSFVLKGVAFPRIDFLAQVYNFGVCWEGNFMPLFDN